MYSSRFKEMLTFTEKKILIPKPKKNGYLVIFVFMNSKFYRNHVSIHNFPKKITTTITATNDEFVPKLVMLLLFTNNQRN